RRGTRHLRKRSDRAPERSTSGARDAAEDHRPEAGGRGSRGGEPMSSGEARRPRRGIGTTAIHGGERRPRAGNALTTPIFQTATFVFQDTAELSAHHSHEKPREEYGRYGNPTTEIAEAKCAALEGAEAGLAFA